MVREKKEVKKQRFISPVMSVLELSMAHLNQRFHWPKRISVYIRRFIKICM
jgi:hypothetical protein